MKGGFGECLEQEKRRYDYPKNNPQIRPDQSAIVEAEEFAALIKKLKLKS